MKKLILLLSLITTVAWGSSAIQAPTVGYNLLNLTGINLLTGYNNDFELGNASYWTASSGDTLTVVSGGSNLLFNTTSGAYTASASGKFLVSSTVNVPVGLQGGGCYLGLYYKYSGATGDYSVSVDNATDTLAAAVPLPHATSSRYVEINYPCGTTSNRLKITSNVASPSTIYIDNAYMGSSKNVGTSAQAVLVGGAVVTGCANPWSTASTSFASLGTQTGCTYTTFGLAQAPSTNVAGIKFASLPPGDYMVQYEGAAGNASSAKFTYFQFTDGTNNAKETSMFYGGGSNILSSTINQIISYSTAQSNLTLQLYAKTDSAGSAYLYGQTAYPGTFKLWYFPSSAQQAVKVDQTPASWSGYHDSTCVWSRTNTALGDPTADATCGFTEQTNRNFGTVTSYLSGSDKLPGIVFTPTKVGRYFVCATVNQQSNNTSYISFDLSDLTPTVISAANTSGLSNAPTTSTMCGVYNATAVTSTTIRVRSAITGGSTVNIASGGSPSNYAILWSITALDQGMAVPFLQGNVTSNTSGQERIERVSFGGATEPNPCTSSPCTIYRQSGSWVSSVTRSGNGQYTVNFVSGSFTSVPTCVASSNNTTTLSRFDGTPTTSAVNVVATNTLGTGFDAAINIICMGPKN